MAEAKTGPPAASVAEYFASRASPEQVADCKVLEALIAGSVAEVQRRFSRL